jgi:hypothetical protein
VVYMPFKFYSFLSRFQAVSSVNSRTSMLCLPQALLSALYMVRLFLFRRARLCVALLASVPRLRVGHRFLLLDSASQVADSPLFRCSEFLRTAHSDYYASKLQVSFPSFSWSNWAYFQAVRECLLL